MVKRRVNEEASKPGVEAKKAKMTSEMNGTHLKSLLREPTSAFKALGTFVALAKKLPSPELYDVVEGYVKISMECAEIFHLLTGEKQTDQEVVLIFASLEAILLRTASDLSHFSAVGNTIVKKILSGHTKLLQSCFHSENYRLVRQCLNLLSASTSQGPEAAREVLAHVHVNKSVSRLARARDRTGKDDVRVAFIQFALSFLVSGDNNTVGHVLEIKELLPEILATGLKEDRMSLVNLILSTLKSRVLFNKAISKTQKVRFFTAAVLANIASLYKWRGIADVARGDDHHHSVAEKDWSLTAVREMAHAFLMDVCCSRKHGISFHDASLGTAGRAGNIVLLQFLVRLRQVAEDSLVGALLVGTLRASPDLLARYFKESSCSYSPRLKNAWRDNVHLLKKIYEAQPEMDVLFQKKEALPAPRLLAAMAVISLPPVCNKAFFTQGLKFANTSVQLTTFGALSLILKKALNNVSFLSKWRSDAYAPEQLADLLQQYREMLSKILPDMTLIVSLWQLLSKKEKMEGEKGAKNAQRQEGQSTLLGGESPEAVLLKVAILRVIRFYQQVVPHLVSQCKFDFGKLLKGVVSEAGGDVSLVVHHQMLQLALELPASKFSCVRLQEAPRAKEKSVLYLLLKMFAGSRDERLKASTGMLVIKVLKDRGAFDYTWAELQIWLDHLDRVDADQRETVIHFLEQVLTKAACQSHVYMDRVAGWVQEAAYSRAYPRAVPRAVPAVVSHLDDALDGPEVVAGGSQDGGQDGGDESEPPLSQELLLQMFPFSVAVPAALEARNNLLADKGAPSEYVSGVLCDVLHGQRDPLPLCLALLQSDRELASSSPSPAAVHPSVARLHRYYWTWLPPGSGEPLFPRCGRPAEKAAKTSLGALLKAAHRDGLTGVWRDDFAAKVEAAAASSSAAELLLCVKQLLLYVQWTLDNFATFSSQNTASDVLKSLMGILRDLVVKLRDSPAPPDPQKENGPDGSDGSDLFLDANRSCAARAADREETLLSALDWIFKHPCLEQRYLASEPPHSPSARLDDDITELLETCAPALRRAGRAGLLAPYARAAARAFDAELSETPVPVRRSAALRALLCLRSPGRDAASALTALPRERLVGASGQLTVYGQAAMEILSRRRDDHDDGGGGTGDDDGGTVPSKAVLDGLGALLLSCSDPAPEALLLRTLDAEPWCARLLDGQVLEGCLRQPPRGSLAVAGPLVSACPAQRLRFQTWCLVPGNGQRMGRDAHVYLPLVRAYLLAAGEDHPAVPRDVREEVAEVLKENFMGRLMASCLGDADAEDRAAEDRAAEDRAAEDQTALETLALLLRHSAGDREMADLTERLPDVLQKAGSFHGWQVADVVAEKLAGRPPEEAAWRRRLTASALKRPMARHPDDAAASRAVLERLQRLVTSGDDVDAADWNSFVKNGLRYRYRDECFLDTLGGLLDATYPAGAPAPAGLIPLSGIHAMTLAHSSFLPTMLEEQHQLAKEALVRLLLRLVRKCPTVCHANHFLVLLGAYGATLSHADQSLLLLLREYENNKVSLLRFQSLAWGPAAVDQHKTRKSLGSSLWKQSSPDDLLALLNGDKMLRTVARYPQHRKIIPKAAGASLFSDEALGDPGQLYDPAFLLSLFAAVLRPESTVNCSKFVSSQALALSVAALSSYDASARAAAYHVLACFCRHLEAARFKERKQLLYLLEAVRKGVRRPNQRLPFLLTTYIGKVSLEMLKPGDHMYAVINHFLLSHQNLDMKRVPEFFKLFYSFDLKHKSEREWILNVLERGVSDGDSYQVCQQQGVFHILLAFASGPLCDLHTQEQIIRVLRRAASVTKAAYDLCKSCGLLTWMMHTLEKRDLGPHLLGLLVDLLQALWFTNLGKKAKLAGGPPESRKCLPLTLLNEFFCAALSVIRRLGSGAEASRPLEFLRLLASVLQHRADARRGAGQTTAAVVPLSSAHVLALLSCWSSASGRAGLPARIRAVAEKHGAEELSGGRAKERARGRAGAPGGKLARVKEEEEDDEEEKEKEEEEEGRRGLLLTEGPPLLLDIFAHWRPELDAVGAPAPLAADTGRLLAELSLEWLLGAAYRRDRVGTFLRWLEERGELTDALRRERPRTGADLLRLYGLACRPPRGVTFRRFTRVMTRSLERGGPLPEALLSACRSGDASTCDAALSLLSMYIHEAWSAASPPQLFLSHVARVAASERNGGPSALRAVCRDILAAASAEA
ncbi:nucleolar pre-ribosomal-associated protein 1 [Stigmatopora nigra]